jgi:predicted component of type VI protein secretion system
MHAKVIRQVEPFGARHVLIDMDSTCGTFVNGIAVDPHNQGTLLRHGDVISLGPSQTSTYIYYQAARTRSRAADGTASPDTSWVWRSKP